MNFVAALIAIVVGGAVLFGVDFDATKGIAVALIAIGIAPAVEAWRKP